MNLKSLTLETRSGGLSSGLFAPHLELVDEGGVQLSGLEVAEAILTLAESRQLRLRDVYLSGSLVGEANEDTAEMLSALLARGRNPVVETSGYEMPRWLALCPVRIALVTEEPWLAFPAQEIHYKATVLQDPNIDPKLHSQSSFVLDPQKNVKAKDILAFFAKSAFIWRIASTPKWKLSIDCTDRLIRRRRV